MNLARRMSASSSAQWTVCNTFNRLWRHPGRLLLRTRRFFPSSDRDHRLPTDGWPGWVDLDGWLHIKTAWKRLESANGNPSQY